MTKYKLHKSEKGQEGKYQILELDSHFPHGLTCGVFFKKKDAIEYLKELNKE